MKAFTDNRRLFWLAGIATLIVGFIVAAVLLPTTSDPLKDAGPAVNVPKLENVPPEGQRLKLEVEKEPSNAQKQ